METHPRIFRNGNKFKLNMTSLEFLAYSKKQARVVHDASYYKPKRDENGDLVRRYNGSATAVKGLRDGFQALLAFTDPRFTGRLMKIVTGIYKRDSEGEPGKKSVYFSREKDYLSTLQFNIRLNNLELLAGLIKKVHSEDRLTATLLLKDFCLKRCTIPAGAHYFRIFHHLSIVSDYVFSENRQCYAPLSWLNGMSAMAFSAYTPVESGLIEEIRVSFPPVTRLSEDESVIQIVGIEYSMFSADEFLVMSGSGVIAVDVY